MIARALRLAIVLCVIAALLVLFFYAFVIALVVAPVVLVLFYLFGRQVETRFWTVQTGARGSRRESAGPVIDHDPEALSQKSPAHKTPEE